jgi:DNA-binding winged helix-turn-helix (wHTH) protein
MARGDRSVDVFVRKLRAKLEAVSPEWRYVHTHFGVGYRFAAERADGAASEPEPGSPPVVAAPAEPERAPALPTARVAPRRTLSV